MSTALDVLLGVWDAFCAVAAWAGDWVPGGGLECGDAVESDGSACDRLWACDSSEPEAFWAELEFDVSSEFECCCFECECAHRVSPVLSIGEIARRVDTNLVGTHEEVVLEYGYERSVPCKT